MGTQLPSIYKNPFEIEEIVSDDAFTAERMVNVLQDSRFFKEMDAAVLETLPKHAKFLQVPNGAVLFRQGDPAKGCYIIVSGKVGFYAGGHNNTPRQPVTEVTANIPEAARRVHTYEGGSLPSVGLKFYQYKTSELIHQISFNLAANETLCAGSGFSTFSKVSDYGQCVKKWPGWISVELKRAFGWPRYIHKYIYNTICIYLITLSYT